MSIALNGSTQALTRTATVFDQNGDFTWSAWYRFASVQSGAFFHSTGANVAAPVPDMDACLIQSTTTRVQANDVAGTTIDLNDGSNTFSVDTWYYVTLQRTGSTLRAYIRPGGGTTALSVSITASVAGRAAAALMVVGRRGTSDRYHACQVAYMRVHTSVLTTGQIDTEAASATAVITSNLWGSWKLSTSSDLADDSGNSRDLTAVNSPSTGADTPADVVSGPTITAQPTAQTCVINDALRNPVTFSLATAAAITSAPWELETSVASDSYNTITSGVDNFVITTNLGAGTSSVAYTASATTHNGKRVRGKPTDAGGITVSNAVVLTVKNGVTLTDSTDTLNGSGVATNVAVSDIAQASGQVVVVEASQGGSVIARCTQRFT